MSEWTDFAMRIQSIAQAGLAYGENPYDRERYEQLREIAAQMVALETELPLEQVKGFFCNETGYQTPQGGYQGSSFPGGKNFAGT